MKTPRRPIALFLCTGNYYRSRFAELYFNAVAAERGLSWQSTSRGLRICPENIGPMSRRAVQRLQELGLALPDPLRHPALLQHEDLQSAALRIAVKEAEHRPWLLSQFPDWVERFEYWHIHDLDCATPAEALPELESCVLTLIDRLTAQA